MPDTYPAQTVDDAYNACYPDEPLPPDSALYVDLTDVRGGENLAQTVSQRIERTRSRHFIKQLISGHRGTGKSTELQRLMKSLREAKYFAVYLDIEATLNLGEIKYQDVLVAIAQALVRDVQAAGIAVNERLVGELKSWFDERILTKEQKRDFEAILKTEVGAEGHVPFFAKILASITAQMKSGSSQRTELREKIEAEMEGFMERLNTLLGQARQGAIQAGYVDIVVAVDGLEKMRYYEEKDGESSHSRLFIRHAEQLAAPQCHILYTLPISLCYKASLKEEFPERAILFPMVDGTKPEGTGCLVELIHRRVAPSVFDSEATLQSLAAMSGGSVRDMLRLVRAATDTAKDKITAKDAERAIQDAVNEYDRLLREGDIEKLIAIDASREIFYDADAARYLEQRIVHEYRNGTVWYAVHPAMKRTKRYRNARESKA